MKVPVFQRLFILFKLKPFDARVQEVMREKKVDRKEAEGIVKRLRKHLPGSVSSDYVYIKLFKNMPRSDVEMIFPNTKVRFRLFDKIKFGVTAGSGLGMGAVGTVSKIALASQPLHPGDGRWLASAAWPCARPAPSSTSATATWW